MKVYKVVRENYNGSGRYASIYAASGIRAIYDIGEIIYRPKAPVLAFTKLEQATKFCKEIGSFIDCSIFEAEADICSCPKYRLKSCYCPKEIVEEFWQRHFLGLKTLGIDEPEFFTNYDFWPEGTVACFSIRLDKKVSKFHPDLNEFV
jgi:hypothetical protein